VLLASVVSIPATIVAPARTSPVSSVQNYIRPVPVNQSTTRKALLVPDIVMKAVVEVKVISKPLPA
jgi:N-acetyl-beta-hexosaminidase